MCVSISYEAFHNIKHSSPDLICRGNKARINTPADVPPSEIVFESWSSVCLFCFDVFVGFRTCYFSQNSDFDGSNR